MILMENILIGKDLVDPKIGCRKSLRITMWNFHHLHLTCHYIPDQDGRVNFQHVSHQKKKKKIHIYLLNYCKKKLYHCVTVLVTFKFRIKRNTYVMSSFNFKFQIKWRHHIINIFLLIYNSCSKLFLTNIHI